MHRLSLFPLTVSNVSHPIFQANKALRAVNMISLAEHIKSWYGQRLASLSGLDPTTKEAKFFAKTHGYIPFAELLSMSQRRICSEPRDRVIGMLSLTSPQFRSMVTVSYTEDLTNVSIQVGKACLEQNKSIFYLALQTGRPRPARLPSWCVDVTHSLTFDSLDYFGNHLSADLRHGDHDAEAIVRTFPNKNHIDLVGAIADPVDRVVAPFADPWAGDANELRRRLLAWPDDCLRIGRPALQKSRFDPTSAGDASDPDTVPLAHLYAVAGNITQQVPDGEALRQSYRDFEHYCNGYGWPPGDRLVLLDDTYDQIFKTCQARAYFTTAEGRVGVGPPEMRSGDLIVVIYGAGPVFILREIPGSSELYFAEMRLFMG
ncbi:hypothetical protein B0H63DRAFT_88302 [Podospora didyma]|uniref:Uncharacterized protein n=1 Tax=Podospora didyma TaxID=330526 RepID=A0AAE0K0T3_9PEZI|nr:hypothetical protein B0H63DRAFT_88302 [Podospora didyma]